MRDYDPLLKKLTESYLEIEEDDINKEMDKWHQNVNLSQGTDTSNLQGAYAYPEDAKAMAQEIDRHVDELIKMAQMMNKMDFDAKQTITDLIGSNSYKILSSLGVDFGV